MWHTEFNLITAYPARLGKTAAQGPAGLESRTAVLLPASLRANLRLGRRTSRTGRSSAFPPTSGLGPWLDLLDEPTSHLDPATADATLMAMLERTGQRAVLWVTHRAAELAAFPDVVDLAVRRHAGSRAAG
jgi:hypothetical protein